MKEKISDLELLRILNAVPSELRRESYGEMRMKIPEEERKAIDKLLGYIELEKSQKHRIIILSLALVFLIPIITYVLIMCGVSSSIVLYSLFGAFLGGMDNFAGMVGAAIQRRPLRKMQYLDVEELILKKHGIERRLYCICSRCDTLFMRNVTNEASICPACRNCMKNEGNGENQT